jgi:hypothetical protein
MGVWDIMLLGIRGLIGGVFKNTDGDENRCTDGTDTETRCRWQVTWSVRGWIDAQHSLQNDVSICFEGIYYFGAI